MRSLCPASTTRITSKPVLCVLCCLLFASEIMAGRSNYRVKIDLSKYHQDARRLSWIYVDSAKVFLISHLKRHIIDVFGIREPFHLLLNGNEYLPPDEDVRILNDNESIVVEPGSGLCNGIHNALEVSMSSSNIENGFAMDVNVESQNDAVVHKRKSKTNSYKVEQNGNQTSDVGKVDATVYHSMLDVSEVESYSDSRQKNDDTNMSTIEPYRIPAHKRKRVRRKKSLKEEKVSPHENIIVQTQANNGKPKFLDPGTPPAKHIRFEDPNDHEPVKNQETVIGTSCPSWNSTKTDKLGALLVLGQCSTPLVFRSQKRVNGVDREKKIQDTEELPKTLANMESLQNVASNGNHHNAKDMEEENNYANLKPEEYPILGNAPEINDIVAFKILRMGNEYTPEVSDYIVAKTISSCQEKKQHTFKILRGHEQIEGPSGKFSLPEDETECSKSETVEFNFSQFIEPRLITRK